VNSLSEQAQLNPQKKNRQITTPIRIGKDILEFLTGAMYVDPLVIYREYVQNAVDAIEEAQSAGLYKNGNEPTIEIFLDQKERSIRIRDNGIGVTARKFATRLSAIGGSEKRGKNKRGFRGVGRLSGLGYAQQVIFRSRASATAKTLVMTWDGRTLKDLLRRSDYDGALADAVKAVATVASEDSNNEPAHFFEVELRGVLRIKNDTLMNEQQVRFYLSQVVPVPFHTEFSFGARIDSFLNEFEEKSQYVLWLNDGKGAICRPHTNSFQFGKQGKDDFGELEFIKLSGIDGELDAVGWILHHSYYGALSRTTGLPGVRVRSGGIQVGSIDLLASMFPEPRFNSWCVGELHILNNKIVPNGRRDDFEENVHYQNLQGQFAPYAKRLTKLCREKSIVRNRLKNVNTEIEAAHSRMYLLNNRKTAIFMRDYVERSVQGSIRRLKSTIALDGLESTDRQLVAREVEVLTERLANALRGSIREHEVALSASKRQAYEEVLGLICELAPDANTAQQLVEKVTTRIIGASRTKS